MITRRSAIQILGLGVLLVGTRLAVDLTSAAAYVYPSFDFGQFWFAFLLFLASLVFVAILAIIRLFRRRLAEGIALLAVLCVPFLFKDVVDRHQWKFRLHKSEYQSAIKADPDQPPKYRVFSWGNRNTHSMGGGVILEAIVYDESDGITGRSPEWMKRRSSSSPEELWITARPNPSCKRRTEYLGEHFYYVSEEC